MNRLVRSVVLSVVSATVSVCVLAQAKHGSKDEAQALVKKAVAHYKSAGKDKALADFSQKGGAFTDRDLYVYTAELTGKCTSHGANDKLVGRDLLQLKDADGKAFVTEIIEKGKTGKGAWTDYKWPNPVSKEIEQKSAYCEPLDGQMFCVGAYK